MNMKQPAGPVIKDQFGSEAFLTLVRWLWGDFVSQRKRPTLDQMRALWEATEQAKANHTIAMQEAADGFDEWWGDRFAHVEEQDAAREAWRAAIAKVTGSMAR